MGKVLFWVDLFLIFVAVVGGAFWPDRPYWRSGVGLLVFIALVLLGLKVFGFDV